MLDIAPVVGSSPWTTGRVLLWHRMEQAEEGATASGQDRRMIPLQPARAVNHSYTHLDQPAYEGRTWPDLDDDPMSMRPSGELEAEEPVREALARLRHLETLDAGWDGSDVAGPIREAIRDSMTLIIEMANAGTTITPRIGLDSDGTVSFLFVRDGRAIADVTIKGDATYSFYACANECVASSDDAPIGWPVPRDLLSILAS